MASSKSMSASTKLPSTIDPAVAIKVLRDQRSSLLNLIRHNLPSLADALFSKHMIPQNVREQACNQCLDSTVKGGALLDCVESRVKVEPSDFAKLVDIMASDHYLASQAEKLVQCYCDSTTPTTDSPDCPPSTSPIISHDPAYPKEKMEMPMFGEEDKTSVIEKKLPRTRAQRGEQLFEEVQTFCKMVDIIVHTVNSNETLAVLHNFDPPELYPGKPILNRAVDLYEPNRIALGMFGGYRSALIQTEMGRDSRGEVECALEDIPSAKFVLAIGVAYSYPKKAKFGDVLVSNFIDGVGNIKYTSTGMVIARAGPTRFASVSQPLRNVFARIEETWYDFKCVKIGSSAEVARKSKVHSGLIISSNALVNKEEMRDNITRNAPEAIGGEMEGVVLVEIQQSLAQREKRELGVIVIKGVADHADGKKEKGWQFTAAMAAASYAKHKLEKTEGKLFTKEADDEKFPTSRAQKCFNLRKVTLLSLGLVVFVAIAAWLVSYIM